MVERGFLEDEQMALKQDSQPASHAMPPTRAEIPKIIYLERKRQAAILSALI